MVRGALILLAMTLLVGCAGAPAVDYRKGDGEITCESGATGRCDLYADRSRLVGSMTIVRGEPLGFRKEGREVVAVAGPDEIWLPDGNYRWIVTEAHSSQPELPAYRGTWHETIRIGWRAH